MINEIRYKRVFKNICGNNAIICNRVILLYLNNILFTSHIL